MQIHPGMYKKSALAQMYLARELFLIEPGEKIPTIQEFTLALGMSRGIVQDALEALEESGSIATEKRGVLGTFLLRSDPALLYSQTGWGSSTGGMPIPLTPCLISLSTAVCEVLSQAPNEFSFAYMSGAAKRVKALREGFFDFVILSRNAARLSVQEYPELTVCAELPRARYGRPFQLCFLDPEKNAVEDGMRIGVDPVCLDQKYLTEALCRDKKVTIVEFPFVGIQDIIRSGRIDCTFFRDVTWNPEWDNLRIRTVPVSELSGLEDFDAQTPVVLVRKDNYGIGRLISKYLDGDSIVNIQQQVLTGRRSMKFY